VSLFAGKAGRRKVKSTVFVFMISLSPVAKAMGGQVKIL